MINRRGHLLVSGHWWDSLQVDFIVSFYDDDKCAIPSQFSIFFEADSSRKNTIYSVTKMSVTQNQLKYFSDKVSENDRGCNVVTIVALPLPKGNGI
jgi:hypothetical protein